MASFSMADFLYSMNVGTLALAAIIGLFMGVAVERATPGVITATWVYWRFSAGLVFFISLAVLRAWQGSDTWARLFGTGVLWGVFVVAEFVGSHLSRRYWSP
jgi:hypothetical protein